MLEKSISLFFITVFRAMEL